jgi:hypothetical protein
MGFWEKSVRIFTDLCEAGTQRVRHLAPHTGVSKSSAHRLTQAMRHRDIHPESWLWETAEGRRVRDHRVATRGRCRSWCLVSCASLAFSSGPDLILPR